MEECLFCRIVRGEIPSRVVYEDDVVFAFDDIAPQAPVHTLVVPKHHYRDLGDGIPIETLGALFAAVPRVAELKGVNESGYRVIVNNGPDAGQTKVVRGGAWRFSAEKCRSGYRYNENPGYADVCFGYDIYGFRCVRKPR